MSRFTGLTPTSRSSRLVQLSRHCALVRVPRSGALIGLPVILEREPDGQLESLRRPGLGLIGAPGAAQPSDADKLSMVSAMHISMSEAVNPLLPNVGLLAVVYTIAVIAIWLLLMWLIIYSAVRAALTSHRKAMAADVELARGTADQRRA